ncbi:MAG: hypothetical protein PHP45_03845 [Elusimicrobiales bacterium]|nr:hypothetical protein [Elusimicrobiales bacterium]
MLSTRSRRGQTTVEYLLTTLALLFVFTAMYRFFSWFMPRQFRSGASIILKMYKQDPW